MFPTLTVTDGHARSEKLLRSIDRSDDSCTHDRLLAPMPWTDVENAGMAPISLPETQIHPRLRRPNGLHTAKGRRCWWIPRTVAAGKSTRCGLTRSVRPPARSPVADVP